MLGTSGIRGKYGEKITPSLIYNVSNKFAQGKNIVYIGKDIRDSSDALYYAAISGALSAGSRVYGIGTVATGILGFAGTGMMITASHNPEYDNGIKFFIDNIELTKEQGEFLNLEIDEKHSGLYIDYQERLFDKYMKNLDVFDFDFTLEPIDLNSSAYTFFNYYISQTRIRLKLIDNTPYFLRNSEPIQENVKIDRGFMLDGDGDRVVLIREKKIIDGDRMFAALAKYMHETRGTDVLVVTVECPIAIKNYLSNFYNKIIVTKVGSNYIAQNLKNYKNVGFGGEPNGHYIIPSFNLTSDGIAGMALITEFLKTHQSLPEINYRIIRKKFNVNNKNKVIEGLKESISNYEDIDGILIEDENSKVLIRASGTESLIRLTIEGPEGKINELIQKYESLVLENIKKHDNL